MRNNLVSIVVPCFNQAEFLDEALQSVLDQSYAHWECVVINDGSHDNTEKIVKTWLEKDSRFSYISQQNKGLSEARNVGIDSANGNYILPLDADDKIASEYIKLAVEALNSNDALRIVYCKAEYFGGRTGVWNIPEYTYDTHLQANKIFCSAVFRKKDWIEVEGYDTNMKYGLEDWEFWINMLKRGGEVKRLDYIGFYYRTKETSMIKSMTPEQIEYSNRYVWQKHQDAFSNSYNDLIKENNKKASLLRSSKHAINLLVKRIFGITLFK